MRKYANHFLCVVCLFTGGMLYILFRESTYLGKLLTPLPCIALLRMVFEPLACDFLSYYLPDFLWCLSLGCGLQVIGRHTRSGVFLCGFIAILCALLWEWMQFLGVISGTGDYWDIFSGFLAGALCIILNLKETNK